MLERPDLSGELDKVLDTLKASVQAGGKREEWMWQVNESEVKSVFRKLNARKAQGPEYVSVV